jgi:hypothetical protein
VFSSNNADHLVVSLARQLDPAPFGRQTIHGDKRWRYQGLRNNSTGPRSGCRDSQHRIPEKLPESHDFDVSTNQRPRPRSRNDAGETTRSALLVSVDQSRQRSCNLRKNSGGRRLVFWSSSYTLRRICATVQIVKRRKGATRYCNMM